ncbi:MFS transporter [Anoxybacillus sp. KU2-6(11)]|uniref:MFS transporter n=1 Tax=Anoxybacillus sp. KU2-6(11) TaxID=1535751 RepID=UPI0009E430E1|nr:MFS transporter [Anoxybacillus sp. KU2-6(11)]
MIVFLYPFLIGKDKKKVSAISYWLNNLSAVVGILVGTFSSINNLSILFIFMAIICCISAILFNKTLTEEGSLRTTSPKGGKIDKQTNKTDRNVLLIICFSIGTCLIFMIESRLNDLLSVYLTHKQIIEPEARKIIGNILLVNYGTVILFSPFIEKLIKSISAKKRLIAGMIIMSFSVVMIFSGELKLIEVYMYVFLYTIGEVFYFPSRQVEIASLIPKENVTAAYALDRTVITGAKLLSTLLILIVAIPYLFCLVILICIFSSIVLLLSQVYSKKKKYKILLQLKAEVKRDYDR